MGEDSKRILLVDPDAGILKILCLMLSEYDCLCAEDGEMALKLYSSFKPALVITEIALPGMSGIEFTRKVLEMDPEAKVIGLTAFKYKLGKEMLEAGALEIVEKPFTKKKLVEVVGKYLNQD